MVETEILLGDEVQCIYTGLKGTAMNKLIFMNGCIQFGIVQKFDKTKLLEQNMAEVSIDSQSLKIIKKGPRHNKEVKKKLEKRESTGGPSRIMRRRM